MLGDIRERLGYQEVRRGLNQCGQSPDPVAGDLDGHWRALCQGADRSDDAFFGLERGMDTACQLAKLLHGEPKLCGGLIEPVRRLHVGPIDRVPGALKRKRGRHQALLGAVMQITLHSTSLCVPSLDDARP
jgi:hypothetical protein